VACAKAQKQSQSIQLNTAWRSRVAQQQLIKRLCKGQCSKGFFHKNCQQTSKVLLEHNHTHSFTDCCAYSLTIRTELNT
jgi:uncharacterized membrane protein